MSSKNLHVASLLDELAARLAIEGQPTFKVRAYRRAALAIEELDEEIARLGAEPRTS